MCVPKSKKAQEYLWNRVKIMFLAERRRWNVRETLSPALGWYWSMYRYCHFLLLILSGCCRWKVVVYIIATVILFLLPDFSYCMAVVTPRDKDVDLELSKTTILKFRYKMYLNHYDGLLNSNLSKSFFFFFFFVT